MNKFNLFLLVVVAIIIIIFILFPFIINFITQSNTNNPNNVSSSFEQEIQYEIEQNQTIGTYIFRIGPFLESANSPIPGATITVQNDLLMKTGQTNESGFVSCYCYGNEFEKINNSIVVVKFEKQDFRSIDFAIEIKDNIRSGSVIITIEKKVG
jgi:hypothetical protein